MISIIGELFGPKYYQGAKSGIPAMEEPLGSQIVLGHPRRVVWEKG